jgi:uncharacterized protein YukE
VNPALEEFFGNPETVLRLGVALRQTSTGLMELRTTLDSRVTSLVPAQWQGAAATAFQRHWEDRSDAIHQAAQTADRLSSAMETLGRSLATAKRLFQLAEQHAAANRLYITPMFVVLPFNPTDWGADAAIAWVQPEVTSAVTMAVTARAQANMELAVVGGASALGMLRDIGQSAIQWVGDALQLIQRAQNMSARLSMSRAMSDIGGVLDDMYVVGAGAWHGAGEIGKKLLGAMEFMGRFSEERQLIDPDGFDRDVKQLVTDVRNTPTSQIVRGTTKVGLDAALVVMTGGGGAAAETAVVKGAGETLVKGAGEAVVKDAAEVGLKDAAEVGARDAAETGARDAAEVGLKDAAETGARDAAETGARDAAETGARDAAETGARDAAETGASDAAGSGQGGNWFRDPAGNDVPRSWPNFEGGEIKPIGAYNKGLNQLNLREIAGNDALITYTNDGWVHMQVFGTDAATGAKVIIQEGSLGQITNLPALTPGTTGFGQAMEPLVLERVENVTGREFLRFGPGYTGPDVVPRPP